jgi:inner membrane protein involved in colicin E2 resistance
MAIVDTISYALMFAVTFVFSILAITRLIENGRRLVLDWLLPILEGFSMVCWWLLVPLHLAFVGTSSAFLLAPAILWFAIGMLFLLFTIKSVSDNLAASVHIKNSVDTVD